MSTASAPEHMLEPSRAISGSFRDPAGRVFERDGAIYRSVTDVGSAEYEAARDAGVLTRLVETGKLVAFEELPVPATGGAAHLLRHPRLATISHPYEWSFALLRRAALFQLELLLDLLEQGFTMSDASAYNIQFVGPAPVFIDHLSIRRYVDGEFWSAHRQFCEQFLNPLLLRAVLGVAPNAWYRGNLEGIATADLARLLPWRKRLSWNLLTHVVLQDSLQRSATRRPDAASMVRGRHLPKAQFKAMLMQLQHWVERLHPAGAPPTTWGDYAENNTYSDAAAASKHDFVAQFVKSTGVKAVIDLGCNTGDYAQLCLEHGAARVIGFDFDQTALDRAYARATANRLAFLPLFLDARNPSPDQGWLQSERGGFAQRYRADAVLALAFEHHLAIAHNVPLDQTIDFIVARAPRGVIEFVPKNDETVRRMLALRPDIFPHYTENNFRNLLAARAKIVQEAALPGSDRRLFQFEI